jgi:HK97 family phage prohead protease
VIIKPEKKRIRFFAKVSGVATNSNRITFKAAPPPAAGATDESLTIGTMTGYPIVWNVLSTDRGGYSVRLMPQSACFFAAVAALYDHDWGQVLGTNSAKTLRIGAPDEIGIPVEIDLPNTTYGRNTAVLVARGDVKGMSFSMMNGFEQSFASTEGNQRVLNVTKFTVDEVSVLVDPAFTQTSINLLPSEKDDATNDDVEGEGEGYSRVNQALKLSRLKLDQLRW